MTIHRAFRVAQLAFLLGVLGSSGGLLVQAIAAPPAPDSMAEARQNPLDLFAAEKAGQIEVGLIPRDEKRVTLIVTNKGDKPLAIRIPDAFAGAPVLAQIGLNPAGNGNNNNARAPQALGVGGPGGQPFGQNNNFNNNGVGFPGGIMNVPPGKTVKVRLPAVCLEYGKPTPYPHAPYAAVPLETVSSDPAVKTVVASLGAGSSDQRIAQLAAWNLANGKSWESLAAIPVARIGGRKIPEYKEEEIEAAQELVTAVKKKIAPAAKATAAK